MIHLQTLDKINRLEKWITITQNGQFKELSISDLVEYLWQIKTWEEQGFKVYHPDPNQPTGYLRAAYIIVA